jgi:hypothetical protein
MPRFNRFGATYADVVAMYPGSVLADYDAGGAAGQAKVEAALDRAVRRFSMALAPDVYRQMTKVDAEMPVRYATEGQTSFALGLGPMNSGTLHVWRYPSLYTIESLGLGGAYSQKPEFGVLEELGWSANTVGAVVTVTLASPAMSKGQRIFASYEVDVDNAAFTAQSVADLSLYGAAVELGAFLYSEGTQEWKLVEEYRKRWEDALKAATEGGWVPDELRKLNYWEAVERASNEVLSIHRPRG